MWSLEWWGDSILTLAILFAVPIVVVAFIHGWKRPRSGAAFLQPPPPVVYVDVNALLPGGESTGHPTNLRSTETPMDDLDLDRLLEQRSQQEYQQGWLRELTGNREHTPSARNGPRPGGRDRKFTFHIRERGDGKTRRAAARLDADPDAILIVADIRRAAQVMHRWPRLTGRVYPIGDLLGPRRRGLPTRNPVFVIDEVGDVLSTILNAPVMLVTGSGVTE